MNRQTWVDIVPTLRDWYYVVSRRLIGVRTCESRCLFSGSRGEVCAIEPLRMHHTVPDHPMKDVIILAMASLTKV